MVTIGLGDVERFQSALAGRLGLRFDESQTGMLEETLRRRVGVAGQTTGVYLVRLETGDERAELVSLAEALTVPETYFFRNIDQFRAVAERVVPDRVRARGPGRPLRIVSAGCASGEEAFTLAIVVADALGSSRPAPVLAVDINAAALDKACRARFSQWSLRETPPEVRERWFSIDGSGACLADSVRAAVTFEERNLADDDADLWRPESYDVVFCRNVLMYFTSDSARSLLERIARSLVPGGYLFLGHAENLRGLSSDFHLCHTHGTFYYQRKDRIGRPGPGANASVGAARPVEVAPILTLVETADDWVSAIREASERVRRLTDAPAAGVAARPRGSTAGATGGWDIGPSLELLEAERFADALVLVEGLPGDAASDPDVLLLRAALLTHRGSLLDAEAACHRLLGLDELNAGAHYLLALCREGTGDRSAAAEHDRVATYLDPSFAMAHVHLGLLARRAGDLDAARDELENAERLLAEEDPARLLLFGGGFSRDALIALCRAEIKACERAR